MTGRASAAVLAIALLGSGCGASGGGGSDAGGDDDNGGTEPGRLDPFDLAVTRLVLEVDYATGAEPYTGSAGQLDDVWQLTRENLEQLFAGQREIAAPSQLSAMQELTDVSGDSFDTTELLAIAEQHDDVDDTSDTVSYYILFVDGLFRDGSGERDSVLGVSIGDSRVIAMFKPVIRSTEGPLLAVSRFVEQSTLIHEMGHAIGLVANGIAITSAHHDDAHGAHCTNQDCVMYHVNEGAADLALYVREFILSGDTLLFGDECIDDVDAELAP